MRGAERLDQPPPVLLGAQMRRDDGDVAPAKGRRHRVDRRQVEVAEHRAERLGCVQRPAAELLEHRGRLVGGPHQHARGDVGDRVRLELRRSHDREPPAAATQRPEQLGLGVRVRSEPLAVGRDNLERLDVVRGQAVRPAQPPGPATERQPNDAHGRGKAEHRSEAMLARSVGDLTGTRACLHAGDPLVRFDLDFAHRRRLQEQRAVQRWQRLGAVAGGLGRDAQSVLCGEPDHRFDVLRRRRLHDGRGVLVDRQVPRAPGRVPAGIPRQRDALAKRAGKFGTDRHARHGARSPPAP